MFGFSKKCGCGKKIIPDEELCLSCYRDKEYLKGFANGYNHPSKKVDEKELTPKILRNLITLCHPDKHGNSKLATETTQWLLQRKLN